MRSCDCLLDHFINWAITYIWNLCIIVEKALSTLEVSFVMQFFGNVPEVLVLVLDTGKAPLRERYFGLADLWNHCDFWLIFKFRPFHGLEFLRLNLSHIVDCSSLIPALQPHVVTRYSVIFLISVVSNHFCKGDAWMGWVGLARETCVFGNWAVFQGGISVLERFIGQLARNVSCQVSNWWVEWRSS